MLWVSELTSGSHPIKAMDVHVGENKNKILYVLRSSKTHWKDSKPQIVKITGTSESPQGWHCPFTIIRQYFQLRGDCVTRTEPLFIFRDRSPVTPTQMSKTLKLLLKRLGLEPENYGTHSFRAGRAVDLLQYSKLSMETIKKLGRWWSNAIYAYLS